MTTRAAQRPWGHRADSQYMDDLRTPGTSTDESASDASPVMHLLEDHVPLTLLADLGDPSGPRSAEILNAEGGPETAWWTR